MSTKIGDKVMYRTPMMQMVEATVVAVKPGEEDGDAPFLDLTFTDPTFNQELTVHDIEREEGIFVGSPHTWSPVEGSAS